MCLLTLVAIKELSVGVDLLRECAAVWTPRLPDSLDFLDSETRRSPRLPPRPSTVTPPPKPCPTVSTRSTILRIYDSTIPQKRRHRLNALIPDQPVRDRAVR